MGGGARISKYFTRIDDTLFLIDHDKEYIIVSSLMYGRYRAEPDRYPNDVFAYNALQNQYVEIKRFREDLDGISSQNDFINIFLNLKGTAYSIRNGVTGPTLIFYKAEPGNYTPRNYYFVESKIDFGKDKKSYDNQGIIRSYDMYCISGLDEPEPDGVWSYGQETVFHFYISPSGPTPATFNFTVEPYINKKIPSQIVEVFANDCSLGVVEIDEAGTYELMFPHDIREANEITVRFVFHSIIPGEFEHALFFIRMFINN